MENSPSIDEHSGQAPARYSRWGWVVCLCGFLAVADANAASIEITEPFLGVRYIHRTTTVPRTLDMHILEIDLTTPGIDFSVTPSNGAAAGETVGQTTRQFLTQQNAQVAINGSFSAFVSGSWDVEGLAASRGDVYSTFQQFRTVALNISSDNVATIIRSTTGTGTEHTPAADLYNTLGGEARLLNNGVNVAPSANESLHPRTAAGVTADGKLLLFTVDGRNPGHSEGMTRPEVADVLMQYGALNAINLDGGGSTTLVFADPSPRVVNVPVGVNNVPGTERVVGSNFAVFATAQTQPVANSFIFADFENGDEGNFAYSLSYSGSTEGINAAGSTAVAVSSIGHESQWSQQLNVQDDPDLGGGPDNPQGGWFVRQLSGNPGAGSPGTRASNTKRPTVGAVGFWAMTSSASLEITLAIDNASDVTADRGIPQPLIADGQWHRYLWNLQDNSQWEGWFNGDGVIDSPDFTLDSIQIFGPRADAVVYLDDIFHTSGLPGDVNFDNAVDIFDVNLVSAHWGESGTVGDANGDGDVNIFDINLISQNWPGGGGSLAIVPEPESWVIAAIGLLATVLVVRCKPVTRHRRARATQPGLN